MNFLSVVWSIPFDNLSLMKQDDVLVEDNDHNMDDPENFEVTGACEKTIIHGEVVGALTMFPHTISEASVKDPKCYLTSLGHSMYFDCYLAGEAC